MQKPRPDRRASAWLVSGMIWLTLAPASARAADAPGAGESQLFALAPYIAQVVRLAALDPALAASLVPDLWIDSLVSGARAVEAEVAVRPSAVDPPRGWPIGPWPRPTSLVSTIETLDRGAVVALFRALKPRLAVRCERSGSSLAACERALRVSGSRLSAESVLTRASGGPPSPITPTQRELARLGVPVVVALRRQVQVVATELWGASWSGRP